MFKDSSVFSSFSVDDISEAKQFYSQTLGLSVNETPMGLGLRFANGGEAFIYPKGSAHQPASHTVLNFPVPNIDAAVDELSVKGVQFEQFSEGSIKTDEKGIMRGRESGNGPDIAWFKDPAGNTLSLLQTT